MSKHYRIEYTPKNSLKDRALAIIGDVGTEVNLNGAPYIRRESGDLLGHSRMRMEMINSLEKNLQPGCGNSSLSVRIKNGIVS